MTNKPHNCWQGHNLLESRIERVKNRGPQVGQTICGNDVGGKIERIEKNGNEVLICFGDLFTYADNLSAQRVTYGEYVWTIINPFKVGTITDGMFTDIQKMAERRERVKTMLNLN